MIPRIFHELWADLFGYYWVPCPICGRMFGGHEKHGILWTSHMKNGQRIGKNVCSKCIDIANDWNEVMEMAHEMTDVLSVSLELEPPEGWESW